MRFSRLVPEFRGGALLSLTQIVSAAVDVVPSSSPSCSVLGDALRCATGRGGERPHRGICSRSCHWDIRPSPPMGFSTHCRLLFFQSRSSFSACATRSKNSFGSRTFPFSKRLRRMCQRRKWATRFPTLDLAEKYAPFFKVNLRPR